MAWLPVVGTPFGHQGGFRRDSRAASAVAIPRQLGLAAARILSTRGRRPTVATGGSGSGGRRRVRPRSGFGAGTGTGKRRAGAASARRSIRLARRCCSQPPTIRAGVAITTARISRGEQRASRPASSEPQNSAPLAGVPSPCCSVAGAWGSKWARLRRRGAFRITSRLAASRQRAAASSGASQPGPTSPRRSPADAWRQRGRRSSIAGRSTARTSGSGKRRRSRPAAEASLAAPRRDLLRARSGAVLFIQPRQPPVLRLPGPLHPPRQLPGTDPRRSR